MRRYLDPKSSQHFLKYLIANGGEKFFNKRKQIVELIF